MGKTVLSSTGQKSQVTRPRPRKTRSYLAWNVDAPSRIGRTCAPNISCARVASQCVFVKNAARLSMMTLTAHSIRLPRGTKEWHESMTMKMNLKDGIVDSAARHLRAKELRSSTRRVQAMETSPRASPVVVLLDLEMLMPLSSIKWQKVIVGCIGFWRQQPKEM